MAQVLTLEPDQGLSVTYGYKNEIKPLFAGGDYINAQWSQPIANYNFSLAWFDQTDYDYLITFFGLVNGSQDTFLFEDPLDNSATNTPQDSGFNTRTQGVIFDDGTGFYLAKKYELTNVLHHVLRPITRPNTIEVYNGSSVLQTEGVDYTINYGTGEITGGSVANDWTWSGSFYVSVRFENESIPVEILTFDEDEQEQKYRLPDLVLKEVKEVNGVTAALNNIGLTIPINYQLPISYNAIDIKFRSDIRAAPSGHESRVDLPDDRRRIVVEHPWLVEAEKNYLITLWRNTLGQFSTINVSDTEAGINAQCRFNNDISFQTLANIEADNYAVYQVDGVEFIETPTIQQSLLCRLWRIVKSDATAWTTTDHDQPLSVGGNIYSPINGLEGTAVPRTSDLSTDSTELNAVVFDGGITEEDILSGKLDDASVIVTLFDWYNVTTLKTLFFGKVGNITSGHLGSDIRAYNLETVSNTSKLNLSANVATSFLCPYKFLSQGNRDCNRPIDSSVRQSFTVVSSTQSAIDLDATITDYKDGVMKVTSGLLINKEYYIADAVGTQVRLFYNMPYALDVGVTVELTKFCAKTPAACDSFSNIANYGGFPELMGNDLSITPPDVD